MAIGLILVIISAILLGVAGLLALITDPIEIELIYALFGFGGACGFLGNKVA